MYHQTFHGTIKIDLRYTTNRGKQFRASSHSAFKRRSNISRSHSSIGPTQLCTAHDLCPCMEHTPCPGHHSCRNNQNTRGGRTLCLVGLVRLRRHPCPIDQPGPLKQALCRICRPMIQLLVSKDLSPPPPKCTRPQQVQHARCPKFVGRRD